MTPSSSRPKLGGAFTKAAPFEGLRLLTPGEPNAPAPAPPLQSVPVSAAPDQVANGAAETTTDEHTAVADDAPSAVGGRGGAATAKPVAAPDDDRADNPAPVSRPKSSTEKRQTRARAVNTETEASPTASSGAATQTLTKLVPVNIDVSVHNQLRQFAARVELPFSVIVLRAIEANAAELADAWTSSPTPKNGGMFQMVDHRTRTRRTEPFAQVQLRLTSADAEVLEGLIRDWNAPSRSALVNEALRRYVMAGANS